MSPPGDFEREAHKRSDDRVLELLEAMKESQLESYRQLSTQIAAVAAEVKETGAEAAKGALAQAVAMTELKGRLAAAETNVARLEAESKARDLSIETDSKARVLAFDVESKARDAKMDQRVDPIEKQFWKNAGISALSGGAITLAIEAAITFLGGHK